jgi:hypothetical protein
MRARSWRVGWRVVGGVLTMHAVDVDSGATACGVAAADLVLVTRRPWTGARAGGSTCPVCVAVLDREQD